MDIMMAPGASGAFIAKRAKHVSMHLERCAEVAKLIMDSVDDGSISNIEYKANPLHPSGLTPEEELNWAFVLDTLNFSFWPDKGQEYEVEYKGKKEVGYLACCAAFMKAHDDGVKITDVDWMTTVTEEKLGKILESDSKHPIPMLRDRHRALRESGTYLKEKYEGQMLKMVWKCKGSAQTLLRAIMCIESFRDLTMYKDQKVSFLKRAQILVADAWGVLKNGPHADLVQYDDLDTLTMFADYRVPQVLCHLKILSYSEELTECLKAGKEMKYGEEMEVEIRGCSIFAVEEIYREVLRMRVNGYNGINWYEKRSVLPIDIDVWLWQYRRDHAEDVEKTVPHHRTRSWYY